MSLRHLLMVSGSTDEEADGGATVADDSDMEIIVTVDTESDEQQEDAEDEKKPKRQPPYAVIVLNDEEHTFQYVIELLAKVFGYPVERCVELARTVHVEGRAVVWSGAKEHAELKRDQIRGGGPDFYASAVVRFPLGCLIEPLPGE